MSELNYNLTFSLGDVWEEGHGRSITYHIQTNYSGEEITNAYNEACKKLGFDFVREAASDFLNCSLDKEYVDSLVNAGIINKKEQIISDEEVYDSYNEKGELEFEYPENFITVFFNIITYILPDFKWDFRDLDEKYLDILDGAGYGLFS